MDAVAALTERGLITQDQQVMLAGFCKRWSCSAFQALIETNMISELSFADQSADILGLRRVSELRSKVFPESVIALLPFPFSRSRACVVMEEKSSFEGKAFQVAIADPWDSETRMLVEDMLPGPIDWCVGERRDVLEAIDRNFPFSSVVPHFWEALSNKSPG
jgi:hypothetical protein